jgi:hypothetical protein
MEKPIFDLIKLEKLKLDSFNPRLPKSMHGKNESEILEFMLLDASLIELMLAIGENDFFPGEQLLVVKNEIDQTYKVVEGNRRLSAVKLLNNPELAKIQKSKIQKVLAETHFRPKKIPCFIFKSEKDIHNYLGFRHITGIKEWRLLEKARYLNELRFSLFSSDTLKNSSIKIAKMVGSTSSYISRILVGFQVYQKIEEKDFYKIYGLDDRTFYFNYISDSLNKDNIKDYLGIDFLKDNPIENISDENLNIWTHWFFEKNSQNRPRLIADSYSLNALNVILSVPEAREAFITRGVSLIEAMELTNESDNLFNSYIQKSISQLQKADNLVLKVSTYLPSVEDDLKLIQLLARKISRTIQDKEEDAS